MRDDTLAVDWRYGKDREREEDFISCVTFGKNEEFAELYLKKGTKIVISGRIRTGSYTDSEGVKRYSSNVVEEEHFLLKARKHEKWIQSMIKRFMNEQEDMKVAMLVFTKCARKIIRIFWKN